MVAVGEPGLAPIRLLQIRRLETMIGFAKNVHHQLEQKAEGSNGTAVSGSHRLNAWRRECDDVPRGRMIASPQITTHDH